MTKPVAETLAEKCVADNNDVTENVAEGLANEIAESSGWGVEGGG